MIIAMITAKLTAFALRLFKKGATTLPGRIALKMQYDLLTKLSRDVGIICVTGTNGKTTTCALIAHALQEGGYSYFINGSGANMLSGVATAFILNSSITGRCRKDYAVLECDESSLPLIARHMDAEAVVVTNLFRDQLDRYGEIAFTLRKIREGITLMPRACLVLNADDPITYSLHQLPQKTVTFGLEDSLRTGSAVSDLRYCPCCGTTLVYQSRTYAQLGNYRCPRCTYRRQTPTVALSDITERRGHGSGFVLRCGDNVSLFSTALGGVYNLYNVAAAAAALYAVGLQRDIARLRTFAGAFGRMERFTCAGGTVLLLLVKNPVGLSGCLRYVCALKNTPDIAFALNDNAADSRDVSWIWDCDCTPLREKAAHVYTVGKRAADMALRLKYDGIATDRILDGEAYGALIHIIRQSGRDFVIFANYTAMMHLRKRLIACFGGKEFWE